MYLWFFLCAPLTIMASLPFPVLPRCDRITIRDKEQVSKDEEEKQKMAEMQTKLRKEQTRKLVAEAIASELQKEQGG